MKFITLDLRIVTFLGAILLGIHSFYKSQKKQNILATTIVTSLPISLGFIFGIIPELPNLWTAIPIFLLGSFLGFQKSKKWLIVLGTVVIGVYSFILLPKLVESNLSQFVNEESPSIQLTSLENNASFTLSELKGKIIVIDFFGTWCKPCIEEMEELRKIKEKYSEQNDVKFLLVCTEFGGDTPEKASAFIEKRNLDFKAAFDHNSTGHKQFGFSGVPALVIIDKMGNIRFKHEGYNPSENLVERISTVIDELQN